MTITIFTSLPPGMNRFNAAGDNIGQDHYRACLKSWRNTEFSIVTVNASIEPISPFENEFGIIRIELDRNAKHLCGKPLIYFSDFMKAIYDHSDGPVVITNADIELELDAADIKAIKSLKPGSFICERRLDYQQSNKSNAAPYIGGFDFFAMHRDDLKLHFDCQLVFGMPWWDHYLPVCYHALGFTQIRLSSGSHAYHLEHDERWDMKNFRLFGSLYRKELDRIKSLGPTRDGLHTMIRRIVEVEMKNIYFPYGRRKNFIPNLFRAKPKDPELNTLFWIAFSNFRLIEKPDEKPMPFFSFSRFLQRLPF